MVATAANEPEAALLAERLAQAGIHAVSQRAIGSAEWGSSGSRFVYVKAADVERAKGLLNADE